MTTVQMTPQRAAASKPPRQRKHMALKLDRTTSDARRQAAAILEVLAGVRTPMDASKVLTLSLPAYYKLEARALQGLVLGCQPPGRGPKASPEVEVRRLRGQLQRLQQELGRYQALARTAQRAAGLAAPPTAVTADARGRRKRRPSVRALKAVEMIRRIVEPVVADSVEAGGLVPAGVP